MSIRCGNCKEQHTSVAAVRACYARTRAGSPHPKESSLPRPVGVMASSRLTAEQLCAQQDDELLRLATDLPVPEPAEEGAGNVRVVGHPRSRTYAEPGVLRGSGTQTRGLSPILDLADDVASVLRGVRPTVRQLYVAQPMEDRPKWDCPEWERPDQEWLLDAGMPLADDYGEDSFP